MHDLLKENIEIIGLSTTVTELTIHGGGGGDIEGSCIAFTATDTLSGENCTIQIDAGTKSTEGKNNHENHPALLLAKKLRGAVVRIMTHPHNDHIGNLPYYFQQSLTKVLIPLGSSPFFHISLRDRLKFIHIMSGIGDPGEWEEGIIADITLLEELFDEEDVLEEEWQSLRGKKNIHEIGILKKLGDIQKSIEQTYGKIYESLHRCMPEGRLDSPDVLGQTVKKERKRREEEILESGSITDYMVSNMFKSFEEVPIRKAHEIGRVGKNPIMMEMRNSGHVQSIPAVGVRLDIGDKRYFFSGDRGRSDISHPYVPPDPEPANSVDVGVFECTYGDRVHTPRDIGVRRFVKRVKRAIQRGEDVLIPTISFDRPLVVLYELALGLKDLDPNTYELCWFGPLVQEYLTAVSPDHPMKIEIERIIDKSIGNRLCNEFGVDRINSLGEKGKKSRIIVCGGGFIPSGGSPFGRLLTTIRRQKNFRIFFPNWFGGPESNGMNLFSRKPFLIDGVEYQLRGEQRAAKAKGFSGHADAKEMEEFICHVMKPGGTVILVHGSDKARKALKERLEKNPIVREKNLTIILPENGDTLTFDSSEHTPRTDSHDSP